LRKVQTLELSGIIVLPVERDRERTVYLLS